MTIEEVLRQGVNKIMYNVDGCTVPFAEKYLETFGESISCNTCAGVLYEAYFKLKNHMAKKDENKKVEEVATESKYTMVNGVVLCTSFSSSVPFGEFTKDNITDEIAEKLLEENYDAYSSMIILK